MTPQETAQMQAMMGGNNFSPLALNALTNQAMGYLPDAQYMTPSQYGAFRTLPQMAYQQPVNQTPGFLKSLALTTNIGATHFYNPAVSPMQQRAEASRYVTDTTASVLSAMGGTAMDLGMLGLGLVPGLGVPMLAASLAGAMLPIHFQGPMEHIANTRALQRLTRGKIVSGNNIDAVMGSGFSTRAARSIDTHLYRRSLNDVLYDDEDYRKMLGEGIQAGMFDYANTPEQYKKILGNIRDNMSTLMEVAGSQDFEDAMKELKRLQDMGAQQGNFHSILRSENAYARMTGLSHSDLVNTYGQMGALEFAQRGLSNIQGSQVAMHNAAVVTMGQRNGTMSAAYVASKGGVSGMAQDMTTQSGEAIGKYQTHLLLAAIDPETGEIRKDFNLDNYTGSAAGLTRLMNDASRNASAIMTGPDAAIKQQKFNRSIPDLIQKLQNKEGSATLQLSKMAEIVGRNALQNRPGNFTRKDYMSAGLQTLGFKADSAQDFVNSIGDIEKQFDYERQQDMLKTLTEFRKSNREWSKAWRWFTTTVGGFWDDLASNVSDYALHKADVSALKNSGMLEVSNMNQTLVQSESNKQGETYRSLADTFNATQDFAKRGGDFSSYLGAQNLAGRTMHIGYQLGGKGAVVKDPTTGAVLAVGADGNVIDCSGWINVSNAAAMQNYNQATGEKYFSDKMINMISAEATSDDIIDKVGTAAGGVINFKNADSIESQLSDGMLIGLDTGDHKWDRGRKRGIDHIVQAFRDPETGEWMISESNGANGVTRTKLSDWVAAKKKKYGNRAKYFGASVMDANARLGGGGNRTAVQKSEEDAGETPVSKIQQKLVDLGLGTRLDIEDFRNDSSGISGALVDARAAESISANDLQLSKLNSTIARSKISYAGNIKDLSKYLGVDARDVDFNDRMGMNVKWDSGNTKEFEKSVRKQYATYLQETLKLSPERLAKELRRFDKDQGYRSTVIGSVLSSDAASSRKKDIMARYDNEFKDRNTELLSRLNLKGLEVKEGLEYADKHILDSDQFTNITGETEKFIGKGGTYEDAAFVKSFAYLKAAYDEQAQSDNPDFTEVNELGDKIKSRFNLQENPLDIISKGVLGTSEGISKFFKRFGMAGDNAKALYTATRSAAGAKVDASKVSKGLEKIMKNAPISKELAVQNAAYNLTRFNGVQNVSQGQEGDFYVDVSTLRRMVKENQLSGDDLKIANELITRAGGMNSQQSIAALSQKDLTQLFGNYTIDGTGKKNKLSEEMQASYSAATKTTVEEATKQTATNTEKLVKIQEHTAAIMAYGVNSQEAKTLRDALKEMTNPNGALVAEQPKKAFSNGFTTTG